jgi:hypothetical protein
MTARFRDAFPEAVAVQTVLPLRGVFLDGVEERAVVGRPGHRPDGIADVVPA